MKAVILAGGLGTRLREETEFRPKPMVEIGGKPILWHIMKILGHGGLREFVVCIGYRGEVIKDYFLNYEAQNQDFTVHLGSKADITYHGAARRERLGGHRRRHRARPPRRAAGSSGSNATSDDDRFLVTYGDGLADVDITALLAFHESHGRLATVTTIRPPEPLRSHGHRRRRSRAALPGEAAERRYVNGGLLRLRARRLRLPRRGLASSSRSPWRRWPPTGSSTAYRHDGFWQPMDTYREFQMLNELWSQGRAPWKVWP